MSELRIMYHGTDWLAYETILREGLRGGYNQKGGNRGTFDTPRLYLAEKHIAKRYAEGGKAYIKVLMDEVEGYWINNGVGERCFVIEGDGILVPPEKIIKNGDVKK